MSYTVGGMTTYTIERLSLENTPFPQDVADYIISAGEELTRMFDGKLDWNNTPFLHLINNYQFYICRRNGEITGHLICYVFVSPLDVSKKILYQISLYAKPDSGRTAYHLFQKFIDIGKRSANHIITMLTSQTNIKPSTLKNLGFEEVETLYRLEIK